MRIRWSDEKNKKLISERGISFEDAASQILKGEIIDIQKHPNWPGQFYFIMVLKRLYAYRSIHY